MRTRAPRRVLSLLAVTGTVLLASSVLTTGAPAHASAKSALLYDYGFVGAKRDAVANSAPNGPAATMALSGPVTAVKRGVRFQGNLTGHESVGFARPDGDTLNEPASASVGVGVHFHYRPPTGHACFGDSRNITQVGRFEAYQPEAKIQFTNCDDATSHVALQCRFAGSLSPATVLPITSSVVLRAGDWYLARCWKTPDVNGQAHVAFAVTNLSLAAPPRTVKQRFPVAALGAMTTSDVVSAGNKYPLPPANKNTDQFKGVIARTVVCAGTTTAVRNCLSNYVGA